MLISDTCAFKMVKASRLPEACGPHTAKTLTRHPIYRSGNSKSAAGLGSASAVIPSGKLVCANHRQVSTAQCLAADGYVQFKVAVLYRRLIGGSSVGSVKVPCIGSRAETQQA